MRKDYEYIKQATDLVMYLTPIGSAYVEKMYEDESKIDNAEGLDELLLYLDDEYIILDSDSSLADWIDKINSNLADNYRASEKLITDEHVLEGIKNNWISFKIVIWDEGIQLK